MDARGNLSRGMKSAFPQPMYGGIKDVLTTVYREGGVRALYRGVGMYVMASHASCFIWCLKILI